jgi:hypothetical protein
MEHGWLGEQPDLVLRGALLAAGADDLHPHLVGRQPDDLLLEPVAQRRRDDRVGKLVAGLGDGVGRGIAVPAAPAGPASV